MCHNSCLTFGALAVRPEEIEGKRVLEVGSRDVNGSLRGLYEAYRPAAYVGVDMVEGPGVDVLCDAGELVERFGPESFDVVLSTELLEHVRDWRRVVSNLKRVCAPGGFVLVTTRSRGFPYHSYLGDYWRYETTDAERIFGDLSIEVLEADPEAPGIFVKARRPDSFVETSLSDLALYSVVTRRKELELPTADLGSLSVRARATVYRAVIGLGTIQFRMMRLLAKTS